jgi:phosphate transport system substrate-binding protein
VKIPKKHLSSLLILFCLLGCGSNSSKKNEDNATQGKIYISVDESIKPIIEAEIDVFHALYKYSNINAGYKSESEAITDLLKDSVRLALVSRTLDSTELEVFKKVKITPRVYKIAIDGVALIVHPSNKDSLMTMKQLEEIFRGNYKVWNQVSKANKNGNIKIVFDKSNSSNVRYIREKFQLKTLSDNVFSADSSRGVIEFVSKNKQALGVVGVNWMSDSDDSTARSFLKSVKVLSISRSTYPESSNDYYQPYQAYMAQDWYPLKREWYILSREARVGLGTGFSAFVTSERGQRIILKSGLVPATMPLRIIHLKK